MNKDDKDFAIKCETLQVKLVTLLEDQEAGVAFAVLARTLAACVDGLAARACCEEHKKMQLVDRQMGLVSHFLKRFAQELASFGMPVIAFENEKVPMPESPSRLFH